MSLFYHCIIPVGGFLYGYTFSTPESCKMPSVSPKSCRMIPSRLLKMAVMQNFTAKVDWNLLNCHIRAHRWACVPNVSRHALVRDRPTVVEGILQWRISVSGIAKKKKGNCSSIPVFYTVNSLSKIITTTFWKKKKMLAVLNYCWWPTTFFAFLQINCFIL